MDTIEQLVRRVQKTQHGFADIRRAADELVAGNATRDSLCIAKQLFASEMHQAVKLLSQLRDDESGYVRKSVGNALRDISRNHKALVKAELEKWDIADKSIEQTHKLASRFL